MNIKRYLNRSILNNVLLFTSILTLPINLFMVSRPEWSYWQGHFIDYWAPKLYLSQLSVWLLWINTLSLRDTTRGKQFLRGIFRLIQKPSTFSLIVLAFFVLIIRQFFTPHPWAGLLWFMTLLSGPVLLGLYLWKKEPSVKVISISVLSSVGLQALLGIYQYIQQSSLAPYYLLGEPSFIFKKDLAISFFSNSILALPYGSTPHPNILAGWMLLGIFTVWISRKILRKTWILCLGILYTIVLLLTESWSAWITAVWSIGLLTLWHQIPREKLRNIVTISLGILVLLTLTLGIWLAPQSVTGKTRNFVLDSSIHRRQTLLQIGFREMPSYPWGTGWAQHLTTYTPLDLATLQYGFVQPIHNVLVIFVIENGFWVLLLPCAFLIFGQKKYTLFFLVFSLLAPVFSLDHFIYTQIQGQYITILLMFFLKNKNSKNRPF